MNQVKAIIVTYNPNIERLNQNISSLLFQVTEIVIIDNFSRNRHEIKKICEALQVHVIFLDQNYGIARALNTGIDYFNYDFDWLLTLDQDSILAEQSISKFFENNIDEKVGIICPKIIDQRMNPEINESHFEETYHEVGECIQSGALFRNEMLKRVGQFNDWLFIDYVDFEYCYRAQLANYKILQFNQIILNQEFGELYPSKYASLWSLIFHLTKMKVFHKMILRPIVSPERMYYRSRNRIYCIQYFNKSKKIATCLLTPFIYLKILFRAQQKLKTFKMLISGTIEGLKALN